MEQFKEIHLIEDNITLYFINDKQVDEKYFNEYIEYCKAMGLFCDRIKMDKDNKTLQTEFVMRGYIEVIK